MLVESEQKYKTLVENSLVGILIYQNDHVIYANSRLRQIIGYDDDDLSKNEIWDFIDPSMREFVKERANSRISGENPPSEYEVKLVRKDGVTIDVVLKSVKMTYDGKPSLLINIVDISDWKNAERELRELSTIVESALLPIIKIDQVGCIIYMNKSAEKMLSTKLMNEGCLSLSRFLSGIDPEEMLVHIMNQTNKGGFDSEILCRNIYGQPIKMRLTTFPLIDEQDEITAIACFFVDPTFQNAEKNLLNEDNPLKGNDKKK